MAIGGSLLSWLRKPITPRLNEGPDFRRQSPVSGKQRFVLGVQRESLFKPAIPQERHEPMKTARILDEESGTFGLEYDNTKGQKNMMRLDATTYETAIREAKSFLGIDEENHDEDGALWEVE